MAVTYGFYNSLNGDRKYYAEQMSSIFNGIITDGVFSSIGDALMTVAGSATSMQVIVKTGRAWFNGTWTQNDAQLPLDISAADVSLARIDAVVLEVNNSNAVRANSIKIVKGTASVNPQKPTLTDENLLHQYALAYVTVPAGASSISASNIEVNVGKTGCPFITSVLQQVDITDVFNQWEAEFDEWFANVKSTLSGDTATNLQKQIDENKAAIIENTSDISNLRKNYNLKIGDILATTRSNPGDEFVECNGQSIPYQNDIDLPIGTSKLSSNTTTSPRIAMKSDNECGLFYIRAVSNETKLYMTFVSDMKNGLYDTPVAINTANHDIDSFGGAYFNGTWIGVICDAQYDLYIYTASDPKGSWAETHIQLSSSDEGGYFTNIRIVNGYAVIVWRASNKSNDTILFYTNDLSKGWSKNIIDSVYAYEGMDIGYYNGYYFLINNNYSSYYRRYNVSYADSLNASVWSPLGDYFATTNGNFMYCHAFSCQSDGLYILICSSYGYKILKITSFNPLNVETCYFEENNSATSGFGNINYNSTFGRTNGKWYLFYSYMSSVSSILQSSILVTDDLSEGFSENIQSYYSIGGFGSRGYAEYDRIVVPTVYYLFDSELMQTPNIQTIGIKYFLKISDTE